MFIAVTNAVCARSGIGAGRWAAIANDPLTLAATRLDSPLDVDVAAVGRGEDASDDRDSDRSSNLAREVVERRSDSLARRRERFGDGRGGRGHRGPHADSEHDQASGEHPVAGGHAELGDDRQPGGDQDETSRAHPARAEPRGKPGREPGGRHHRGRQRQHLERGQQRRRPAHELEVLEDDERVAVEREELDQDRCGSRGQRPLTEHARVEQRMAPGAAPRSRTRSQARLRGPGRRRSAPRASP